jgi:hypothetical protein
MNPYGCIATGREEGMIEIVTPSMTISKIQKWFNKGAFAKEALYEWLKFKNPKEERYLTYLCYCTCVHGQVLHVLNQDVLSLDSRNEFIILFVDGKKKMKGNCIIVCAA